MKASRIIALANLFCCGMLFGMMTTDFNGVNVAIFIMNAVSFILNYWVSE